LTARALLLGLALALLGCGGGAEHAHAGPPSDWPFYGRDPGGSRHAPLDEITRENVRELRVAWTHHTGDLARMGSFPWRNASFQATPILVDGSLYLCSALHRVVALDPETGAERWSFDPQVDFSIGRADPACRGVSSWLDAAAPPGAACRRRIYLATTDARLFALDAATGRPCAGFGEDGVVALAGGIANAQPGRYGVTSPPAVIGDLVVTGSQIGDNQRTDEASGVVRAWDARSGVLRWAWDPVPRDPSDPAWDSWEDGSAARTGAANAWAQLSADPERDLLFVPTGSASPDFYGGERRGRNDYANSVVALRASTGRVVWHFQTVHHDLWDYDVPAQPTLVTVRRDGVEIPAVAQATKVGHVFVLHRETGESLFPVEERPVPASDVPGEEAWPTQPFPVRPAPLVPQSLSPEDAWGLTPFDRAACRRKLEGLRSEGVFTPPSLRGTLIFPGNAGGTNWGSVAFEPGRGLLLVNTSRVAHVVKLIPRAEYDATKAASAGKEVSPQAGTPYGMLREVLLSPLDLPCNPPPWGRLAAVDLATGEVRWEVNLGTTRDIAPVPIAIGWGTPNLGGPITTAGGLVFIAAAMDDYLRAFDVETGEELWKGRLPAGGQATPMTYRVREDGKQYVVIAAGGNARMTTTLGDAVVAFALP
jgi:quinoprotein glucose dehydrogenase